MELDAIEAAVDQALQLLQQPETEQAGDNIYLTDLAVRPRSALLARPSSVATPAPLPEEVLRGLPVKAMPRIRPLHLAP